MFKSIKVKVLVLQAALVLAVAVVVGVATYILMLTTMKKTQQQHLQYSAEHISENLNSLMKYKKQLLEKVATSEVINSYFKKRDKNLLFEYFDKFKSQFPVLSYVNENGLEEYKLFNGEVSENLLNIKNSTIFKEAVWQANTTISSYHASCPEPGGPYVHFIYCHKNYFDEFIGLILSKIPIVELAGVIHEFKFGQSGFALMVDDEGTVLSCPKESLLLTKVTIEGTDTKQINAQIKAMSSGIGRAQIFGTDSYFAFTPVQGQNWMILTILPYKEFMIAPNRLGMITILISLSVLIAGILVSLAMAANITNPIYQLSVGVETVAKGDFSQRVDIKSNDEVGHLGEMFNYMTERLEKTTTSIGSLNAANVQLLKSQKQLELTNIQLVSSNEQLQEFVQVASHDMREPLRKITAFGQMLKDALHGNISTDDQENLEFLISGAVRMNHIVNSLSAYSEVITKDIEVEEIDLKKIVEYLEKYEFASLLEETSGILLVRGPLAIIRGDLIKIRKVFTNLILNSLTYYRKEIPPEIIIRALPVDDGMVRIEVEDNGIGIKPEYHERIFAIFRRLHNGIEYEGVGLGLALCKRIIEKHGGEIGIKSNQEHGTTFWFTLPGTQALKHEQEQYTSNYKN